MIAKKACGLLLVAVMLAAGSAMAVEDQNQGTAAITSETSSPDKTALPEPGNVTAPEKESVTKEATPPQVKASPPPEAPDDEAETENNGIEEVTIADPIEPINRAMFQFNDKLYFWVLKPVAQGYNFVVPEPVRISVRNFFSNVKTPIRFANSLLQGKFRGASCEIARLMLNSTIGVAGFFDVAKSHFDLEASDEDFGQTLGFYGMGGLMYIVWPLLGPSTLRDTIGMTGDSFLNPVSYITPFPADLGTKAYEQVNKTSLELGTYEDIIAASVEPYIGVRDGYIQHRKKQISK
jgi:phospholipid-binding lipoprotein MlaA